MPLRESEGGLWGPGVLDMKAGTRVLHLRDAGAAGARPAGARARSRCGWSPDEEVGSEASRALPRSRPGTATPCWCRAGHGPRRQAEDRAQGRGRLHRHGDRQGRARRCRLSRRARAPSSNWRGRSRKSPVSRELEQGVTVNPGVIRGGTRTNVVAAEAAGGSGYPRRAPARRMLRWTASSAR